MEKFPNLHINYTEMDGRDIDNYSNAEKIILAEQLWDSVVKDEVEISDSIKTELDRRLKHLEEGKTQLYSWNEVKSHLKKLR